MDNDTDLTPARALAVFAAHVEATAAPWRVTQALALLEEHFAVNYGDAVAGTEASSARA